MCVCVTGTCVLRTSARPAPRRQILSAAPVDIYLNKKKTNTESWKGENRLKEINYDR